MSTQVQPYTIFEQAVRDPEPPRHLSQIPVLFRLENKDLSAFTNFCKQHSLQLMDKIDQQLEELARVKFPGAKKMEERQRFIAERLLHHPNKFTFGIWVYFPWAQQVIHLLEEEDYFAVITNRNQNKITKEEQQELRQKQIGVIGLSVGAEAAVTLVQEHLCGRIKIADFDHLDLSNLNRISAGIDEIGLSKITITARRMYRLNPFLELTIYEEGIQQHNIKSFLSGLDLLLEECDSISLKYQIREYARELGVNLIYGADERGLVSIEPYRDFPDLPIFHGFLHRPQPNRESFDSELAFMKALTVWLGGWEAISERSRNSLLQMGQTICGYPQLASEAKLTAGQMGHIARKMLLGKKIAPLFKFLDLEEMI